MLNAWPESQSIENSWLAEAYTRMGNEMRVKGNQRVTFPENGPECKYTALFDKNPCFDPLRTSFVEEPTIGFTIELLENMLAHKIAAETAKRRVTKFLESLRKFQASATPHLETPPEF